MIKVNNKGIRTTLTLNIFHTLFQCFYYNVEHLISGWVLTSQKLFNELLTFMNLYKYAKIQAISLFLFYKQVLQGSCNLIGHLGFVQHFGKDVLPRSNCGPFLGSVIYPVVVPPGEAQILTNSPTAIMYTTLQHGSEQIFRSALSIFLLIVTK